MLIKKVTKLLTILIIISLNINIGADKVKFGGWSGPPTLKFSSIGDSNPFSKQNDFALMLSFRGGFLINNFIIGTSFNAIVNKVPYDCSRTGVDYGDYDNNDSDGWGSDTEACNDLKDPELILMYGGLITGYDLQVSKHFNIEFINLFGFGALHTESFFYGGDNYEQRFFIYEPEISFMIVPKKFFAIALNISYRLPAMLKSSDHIYYSAADISGPAIGFELKFGYFNYKKW